MTARKSVETLVSRQDEGYDDVKLLRIVYVDDRVSYGVSQRGVLMLFGDDRPYAESIYDDVVSYLA
jgi:hypothetical protein